MIWLPRRAAIALAALTVMIVVGCTAAPAPATQAPGQPTAAPQTPAEEALRVALIGNQRFGDLGPMDAFAAGLDRCRDELGMEIHKLESIEPAGYEDDIRAMAREGYDLILTTFPPMTPAQVTVAEEFPETKFRAIYQFINVEGNEPLPNVESTEYQGQHATFIIGALAAKLSKTGKLGVISGDEDPSINTAVNAFAAGALHVNPDISVEFAFAGSWEDPALGKEIGLAMISRGVDFIQTEAAKTQIGVLEATKEGGVLFSGDVADNSELYPEGFVTYHGLDFGRDVFLACQAVRDGTWQGGTHEILDLSTDVYFIPWDATEAWAEANPDWAPNIDEIIAEVKEIEAKVIIGEIEVANDTSTPQAVNP